MKDQRDSDLCIFLHLKFDLLISDTKNLAVNGQKAIFYSLSVKGNQPLKHVLRKGIHLAKPKTGTHDYNNLLNLFCNQIRSQSVGSGQL